MRIATATDEQPIYFSSGPNALFGIITNATSKPNGIGILILQGGAWIPSTGRNQLSVRLARRLAAYGFYSMRMDYRGVGESTGAVTNFRLDRPFVDDVRSAMDCFPASVSKFVVLGTCFGARTALAAAESMSQICGLGLFAPPVRDFAMGEAVTSRPLSWYMSRVLRPRTVSRLFDRRKRRSYAHLAQAKFRSIVRPAKRKVARNPAERRKRNGSVFAGQLSGALRRGTRVLLVYGTRDSAYQDYQVAVRQGLEAILASNDDPPELVVLDGAVHGLARTAIQDQVISASERWLAEVIVGVDFGDG